MMERLIYLCIKGHILPAPAKSFDHEFCINKNCCIYINKDKFPAAKMNSSFPPILTDPWQISKNSEDVYR